MLQSSGVARADAIITRAKARCNRYSSLAYQRRFPIDKLKIDIAFIRNVTRSEGDALMDLSILKMAHSLTLKAIAEGVETSEQLEFLRCHGCHEIQGYFFARPLSAEAFAAFVLE